MSRTANIALAAAAAAITLALVGAGAGCSGRFGARGPGTGLSMKPDAVVLFGAAEVTSSPACVVARKVRRATEEYKTIAADGVAEGSARHQLLTSKMTQRIRRACREVATDGDHDCVVYQDEIDDTNDLPVTDITDLVVARLPQIRVR